MALLDDVRSDWSPEAPQGAMSRIDPHDRTEHYNHYDGGDALHLGGGGHAACLARVKADQHFHIHERGWFDIGYNALVCQHGRAIEGRGIDVRGAHCPDHNSSAYGIQFMVGGDEAPTDAARNRMRQLYDDLCRRSGRRLAKRGHRQGFATECPGEVVFAWVTQGMPFAGDRKDRDDHHRRKGTPHPPGSFDREDVRELQRNVGTRVDGDYGPNTQAKVHAFHSVAYPLFDSSRPKPSKDDIKRVQASLGVAADGIVGPVTRRHLRNRVYALQDGRPLHLDPDGWWGSKTQQAIEAIKAQFYLKS